MVQIVAATSVRPGVSGFLHELRYEVRCDLVLAPRQLACPCTTRIRRACRPFTQRARSRGAAGDPEAQRLNVMVLQ